MLEKTKTHISIILFGVLLSLFSLGSIVLFTDPQHAGFLIHVFFYISLFLACLGIFTVIGILIRKRFSSGIYVVNLRHSLRQASLLALFFTISLLLKAHDLLYWWVEGSLILFLICIELYANVD